jgi:hypothetical protein
MMAPFSGRDTGDSLPCSFFGGRSSFNQLLETLWRFNKIVARYEGDCPRGTVVNANTATNAAPLIYFGFIVHDRNGIHLASIRAFSATAAGIHVRRRFEIAGDASDRIAETIDSLQNSTAAGAAIANEVDSFPRVAGRVNQARDRALF